MFSEEENPYRSPGIPQESNEGVELPEFHSPKQLTDWLAQESNLELLERSSEDQIQKLFEKSGFLSYDQALEKADLKAKRAGFEDENIFYQRELQNIYGIVCDNKPIQIGLAEGFVSRIEHKKGIPIGLIYIPVETHDELTPKNASLLVDQYTDQYNHFPHSQEAQAWLKSKAKANVPRFLDRVRRKFKKLF